MATPPFPNRRIPGYSLMRDAALVLWAQIHSPLPHWQLFPNSMDLHSLKHWLLPSSPATMPRNRRLESAYACSYRYWASALTSITLQMHSSWRWAATATDALECNASNEFIFMVTPKWNWKIVKYFLRLLFLLLLLQFLLHLGDWISMRACECGIPMW